MKCKEIAVDSIKALCGNRCGVCGMPLEGDVDIDHIIPVSFGGKDSLDNLRVIHSSCHKKRHIALKDIQKRERKGLHKIRAEREYTGRPGKQLSLVKERLIIEIGKQIEDRMQAGQNISKIAVDMGLSRPTIYDYKRKYEAVKNVSTG